MVDILKELNLEALKEKFLRETNKYRHNTKVTIK